LEWESQQQMSWEITIILQDNRFIRPVASGRDTGGGSQYRLSADGTVLTFRSGTSWDQFGVVFELAEPARGRATVLLADTYVGDRLTAATVNPADLIRKTEQVEVHSEQHRIRNAFFRLSMEPGTVARASKLLTALGHDRRANIQTLLAAAERAQGEGRVKLLFRAAAACTGGCNHGPLEPDGWDKAIAIYEQVMDEYAGTDHAINARWARALCHGCWSPWGGCDAGALGKRDWDRALELYEQLYGQSADAGRKTEALRRKAELQCSYANDLEGGIETYRQLLDEFPEAVAKPSYWTSPYWTYRTCEPHRSADQIRELLAMSERGELSFAGSVSDDRSSRIEPLVSRGGCRIQAESGYVRLTSGHNDTKSAATVAQYSPPFRLTVRARTDSTNIRLYYGTGWAIFNWEADKTMLMVGDLLRLAEYEVPDKGHLAIDEWHDIVWEIGRDVAHLYADGELVYTQEGDFAELEAPLGIGPAWGSTVDVASFVVEQR